MKINTNTRFLSIDNQNSILTIDTNNIACLHLNTVNDTLCIIFVGGGEIHCGNGSKLYKELSQFMFTELEVLNESI